MTVTPTVGAVDAEAVPQMSLTSKWKNIQKTLAFCAAQCMREIS